MGSIIVVAASKGGVGKSTTSMNLARGFQDAEYRTLCVDLDSANRTLMQYPRLWNALNPDAAGEGREPPLPPVMQLAENFTRDDLRRIASTVDVAIVDMQAGYQRDLQRVAAAADLVIVPGQLGPNEWGPTLETAHHAHAFSLANGGRPHVRILINNIDPGRPATAAALEVVVTSVLPAPLLKTIVPTRLGLSSASAQGLTVFDYGPTRQIRPLYRSLVAEIAELVGMQRQEIAV